MKYSVLLILFGSTFSFGQSKTCESHLDTLTEILVYNKTDNSPVPEGGLHALYKDIAGKLVFPRQHREDGCPKIMFAFIVDESGNVVGLRLLSKKYGGMEEQLSKILKNHKWIPGTCNGKKVSAKLVIPIAIKCG